MGRCFARLPGRHLGAQTRFRRASRHSAYRNTLHVVRRRWGHVARSAFDHLQRKHHRVGGAKRKIYGTHVVVTVRRQRERESRGDVWQTQMTRFLRSRCIPVGPSCPKPRRTYPSRRVCPSFRRVGQRLPCTRSPPDRSGSVFGLSGCHAVVARSAFSFSGGGWATAPTALQAVGGGRPVAVLSCASRSLIR